MDDGVPLVTAAAPRAYCLLEVPPELEAHLVPHADAPPLVLNGRAGDDAALTTPHRTYAVRQVSQSNSLLVCGVERGARAGGVQLRLHANATDTLECVPTPARVDRLAALLDDSAYTGGDDAGGARRYTPHELRSIVQASEAELQEALRTHHVLLLDGHMRRVAPALLHELLRVLVNQLDILACAPERVPYAPTLAALQMAARPEVAERVLCDWFCAPPRPTGVPTHVALATADIARFLGTSLLREARRMPLVAFVAAWRGALGALADEAHLALLHGFFVLEPPPASFAGAGAPPDAAPDALARALTLVYFPHTALPLAPAARFQQLFLARPQWVREELVPFVQALAPAQGLDALLVKHTRASRARWSRTHAAVLLRGELEAPAPARAAPETCTLLQARVRY
ncbi:Ctf8p and Ctf18p associating protein [Malassezia brasiliensis]|uniref:Ctf8p and Ctf18p associating protein n=1 Tax=Malassezia brasiliensis TaxID=1821822 RepID=A0AAF0IUK2_9BASI|nr:Ctf8p and Ctf18p associating protein [Malassezia brasiliensis]